MAVDCFLSLVLRILESIVLNSSERNWHVTLNSIVLEAHELSSLVAGFHSMSPGSQKGLDL